MTDPLLTIEDATREFRVSPKTIRRRLVAGEIEGAYKRPGSRGPEWVMPRPSLVAAGFVARGGAEPAADLPEDDRQRADYWQRRALDAEAALAARGTPSFEPVRPEPARRRGLAAVALGGAAVVALCVAALVLLAGGDEAGPRAAGPVEVAREVLAELTAPGDAVGVLGTVPDGVIPPERRAIEVAEGPDEGPRYVVAALGEDEAPAAELARRSSTVLRLPAADGWLLVLDTAPDLPTEVAPGDDRAAEPLTTAPPSTAPSSTAAPSTDPPSTTAPAAPAPSTTSPAPPAPATSPGDEAVTTGTVVVEAGDSFWSVATGVAGVDGDATVEEITRVWAALIDANADRLVEPGNPDLLHVGQTLVLPSA